MKLQKLELNAFRGATKPFELAFHPSKKLTMVFGENGTGKSTIADAFTCLCTDDLGSSQDRSGAEKKYMASANCDISDVMIKLTSDVGTYSASFSGSSFIKDRTITYPNLRHLRRSQIIKLVDEQPAKRYEALQDYLDVDLIFNSETKLRDLRRRLEEETSSQIRTITEATATIERAWAEEGKPSESWEKWAKEESEKDLKVEQAYVQKIDIILTAYQDIITNLQRFDSVTADLNLNTIDKERIESQLKELEARESEMSGEFLKLLEHAKRHIQQKDTLTQCPLCQQSSTKDHILGLIERQLSSHSVFIKLNNQKEQAIRAESNVENSLLGIKERLDTALIEFEEKIDGIFEIDAKYRTKN